jgi:carboxypeptidase family protein
MLQLAKALFLGLLACGATAFSVCQGVTTGTVLGVVTDPSGAVIRDAQIQITNQANGLKLVGTSAGDGSFKFFLVPIGAYHALITANGFANEQIDNVQVVSGATSNLNAVKLHLATGQSEVVEVNGSAAALLETTDSQVTTTFNTETMANLPLNNGFDTVAELIPGVVGVGADNFSNSSGLHFRCSRSDVLTRADM